MIKTFEGITVPFRTIPDFVGEVGKRRAGGSRFRTLSLLVLLEELPAWERLL